jgi:chemotaxis protein methyltransferase CheR
VVARVSLQRTDVADLELRLLLEAIYSHYHYDFRSYSRASLRRRVGHALTDLGCPTITRLQERVLHEPPIFRALVRYLTVGVSDMFRDPEYYQAVRNEVIPVLRTYPSIKIWVAGCSTGEEAYSLAILLCEEELFDRTLIYATDINVESLRQAEHGVYSLERIPTFSRNHVRAGGKAPLSDYYTAAYGRAVFDRSLRKNIVFSDHSLATDRVFAEVHLISCRNVLIYFDRELQEQALGLFADSLCRMGFLGLGATETVRFSEQARQFRELAPGTSLYRKISQA